MNDQAPAHRVITLYTTDATGATVQLEAIGSRRYKERFWTMFQPATAFVSMLDRPACYHRVFLWLLTTLDPVQFRRISAKECASGARLSVNSAERALMMLECDRVIISNGSSTGAKARRLNNRLVWASTADRHNSAAPDPELVDARGR